MAIPFIDTLMAIMDGEIECSVTDFIQQYKTEYITLFRYAFEIHNIWFFENSIYHTIATYLEYPYFNNNKPPKSISENVYSIF